MIPNKIFQDGDPRQHRSMILRLNTTLITFSRGTEFAYHEERCSSESSKVSFGRGNESVWGTILFQIWVLFYMAVTYVSKWPILCLGWGDLEHLNQKWRQYSCYFITQGFHRKQIWQHHNILYCWKEKDVRDLPLVLSIYIIHAQLIDKPFMQNPCTVLGQFFMARSNPQDFYTYMFTQNGDEWKQFPKSVATRAHYCRQGIHA